MSAITESRMTAAEITNAIFLGLLLIFVVVQLFWLLFPIIAVAVAVYLILWFVFGLWSRWSLALPKATPA